jgi:imidazolonepropionase
VDIRGTKREDTEGRVLLNARIARMTPGAEPYGAIERGAIALRDGRIAWLGAAAELPQEFARRGALQDLEGRWVTPGLIDCHTHLVFAGDRAHEFEERLEGTSYEEIARRGGGIRSTVRATRLASEDELIGAALPRLATLEAEGVTAVEIKSGYGLERESERKMLRVARRLGRERGLTVHATFLGAHAVPPEYEGRADAYINHLCRDVLPAVAAERLADAVDAFCERIGFTPEQTDRLFRAAARHGLSVKLHADQLSDLGGAALAARHRALSADHLEYASEDGIAALARAGGVGVLLPGAFYFLRETKLPPIAAMRATGLPIAVATDCNPGSSPVTSLLLMLNMACTLFRLTPEEAFAGVTRNAARALGLAATHGTLEVGKAADLAIWEIERPSELAYRIGFNPCVGVVRNGRAVALPRPASRAVGS